MKRFGGVTGLRKTFTVGERLFGYRYALDAPRFVLVWVEDVEELVVLET